MKIIIELFLTNTKIRQAFANCSSANIKFSRTQLSEIQLEDLTF